jgi:hypothetical protein
LYAEEGQVFETVGAGGPSESFNIRDRSTGFNKYIRNANNTLEFLNSSFTKRVLSVQDNGTLTIGEAGTGLLDAGAIRVNGGTAITRHLSELVDVAFRAVAARSCDDQTVSIIGAGELDTVAIGIPSSMASTRNLSFTAFVSGTDKVAIRACNAGEQRSPDLPHTRIRVDIWKH